MNATRNTFAVIVINVSLISFLTVALLFTADYEGDKDLLDATIDYVRAQTAAVEAGR